MASRQHCTSSRSSEAIILSSQRPVTDNVSLTLYNDAFDQDLHVVPLQRHVQQRKLRKKRGKASTKVKSTSAFYKSNVWRHNSSIHLTAKCVDVAYSPVLSDDDSHIVADGSSDPIEPPSKKKRTSRGKACHNSSIHHTAKCVDVTYIVSDDDIDIVALTDVTIIVSDDDSEIVALSDNDIIVHGRDTPYSPPVSDEDPNTESDDSTADLFAQMYEMYPDSE